MTSAKGRILCTEDHADTRDLLQYVLSNAGYEVICTDNPVQAIAFAKAQCFDLYLVDSWPPVVSGPDLTRELRKFDAITPVLFYSGTGRDSDKEKARAAGAQEYLVKPVLIDDLIEAVTILIKGSVTGAVVS